MVQCFTSFLLYRLAPFLQNIAHCPINELPNDYKQTPKRNKTKQKKPSRIQASSNIPEQRGSGRFIQVVRRTALLYPCEQERGSHKRSFHLETRALATGLTGIGGVGGGAVEETGRAAQVGHAAVAVAVHAGGDGAVAGLLRRGAGHVAMRRDAAGVPAKAWREGERRREGEKEKEGEKEQKTEGDRGEVLMMPIQRILLDLQNGLAIYADFLKVHFNCPWISSLIVHNCRESSKGKPPLAVKICYGNITAFIGRASAEDVLKLHVKIHYNHLP